MPSSSGISACWPPTNWRMVLLMRCGAFSSKKTGLPSFHSDMCMWPPQPGQSFDHLAMKVASQSRFCASTLVKSLNSAALSAASQPVVDPQRRLEHAGAGLGVQALDAHVHGLAHGEQVAVPVATAPSCAAPNSRRSRARSASGSCSPSRGSSSAVSAKTKNSYSKPTLTSKPSFFARASTRRSMPRGQSSSAGPANSHRNSRLPGSVAISRQVSRQDADVGVGIGGVPAGVGDVVVELVVAVPAQHHVAEAHAALERRLELVDVDVLAAQDAVDVVDAHLDVAEAALLDDLQGIGRRLDLARFHSLSPAGRGETSWRGSAEARGQCRGSTVMTMVNSTMISR